MPPFGVKIFEITDQPFAKVTSVIGFSAGYLWEVSLCTRCIARWLTALLKPHKRTIICFSNCLLKVWGWCE